MKIFHLLIVVFISLINIELVAQIKFDSKYLEGLYENLPAECKFNSSELHKTGIVSLRTNTIVSSKFISIHYYLNNYLVEDIGISILDSLEESLLKSDIISRFIERKMLELLLIKDDNILIEKLNEDKINFSIDRYPILSCEMLQSAYSIMLNKNDFNLVRDSLRYFVNWTNSIDQRVTFTFPATNTLIRAKDKKELDDELSAQLDTFSYDCNYNKQLDPANVSVEDLKSDNNIYFSKGDNFYIKEINNSCFFKKDGKMVNFIYEPDYLAESFCNLVQNPFLDKDVKISINHRKYGYEDVYYTLRLCDLVSFFKNNSTLYTGIEQQNKEGIKAVVLIQNNFLNFINMLVLDINKNDLFGPSKILSSSFHTNIPTDNIQNLFEDYELKEKQFKIKIK